MEASNVPLSHELEVHVPTSHPRDAIALAVHLKNENKHLRRRCKEQSKNLRGIGTQLRWYKVIHQSIFEDQKYWRDMFYEQKNTTSKEGFWFTAGIWANAIILAILITLVVTRIPK